MTVPSYSGYYLTRLIGIGRLPIPPDRTRLSPIRTTWLVTVARVAPRATMTMACFALW